MVNLKDFKKAILEFSMKYELSELNIDIALDELKNKFDILEINMFCNSLKEYNKVGDIIEIRFGTNTSKYEVLEIKEHVKKEETDNMYRML